MRKQIKKRDRPELLAAALPLLLDGKETQGAIAASLGIGRRTLSRWRHTALKAQYEAEMKIRVARVMAEGKARFEAKLKRDEAERKARFAAERAEMLADPIAYFFNTRKRRRG